MMQKIWSFSSQIQLQIVVLLWRWWLARNKVNAGEKRITGSEVCSLVVFYAAQFEKGRKTDKAQQQVGQNKWEPPSEDMYKISINDAFSADTSQGGW
jgi:hypothetical protein